MPHYICSLQYINTSTNENLNGAFPILFILPSLLKKQSALEARAGKQTIIFNLLIHSLNGYDCCGWSRSSLKALSFILVSLMDSRRQALTASSTAFPGTLAGRWIVSGKTKAGINILTWDASIEVGSIAHSATILAALPTNSVYKPTKKYLLLC